MKRNSSIFTDKELKVLNDRLKGKSNVDRTGIFYSRIKPKILELFEWFKKRKDLEKAIKSRRKKKK